MQISGYTDTYCLLGYPSKHSISPAMHNLAFQELNIDAVYLAYDVAPEDFSDVVKAMRKMDVKGYNLTMPHKTAILPLLDELLPAGELAGAVNTVIHRDGKLIGTTTDGTGYLDSLRECGVHPENQTMTILGAGGAARAIIVQAALDGMKNIHIGKRQNASYEEAVLFAESVSRATGSEVTVFPLNDNHALGDAISQSTLLCNATNVGMGEDTSSLVDKDMLTKDLFVSDIIYHPMKTTLLKDAEDAGCKIMNGKYMLLYQGAAAFELWTGQKMPIQLMKERIFN